MKFEENIDCITERYNELYGVHYKLFISIMNEYTQMCKRITCVCDFDDIYSMSIICSSLKCLYIEKFKST